MTTEAPNPKLQAPGKFQAPITNVNGEPLPIGFPPVGVVETLAYLSWFYGVEFNGEEDAR
jgi:hypothetical protein